MVLFIPPMIIVAIGIIVLDFKSGSFLLLKNLYVFYLKFSWKLQKTYLKLYKKNPKDNFTNSGGIMVPNQG